MKTVLLNEDGYYNDPLIDIAKEIVTAFSEFHTEANPIYVEIFGIGMKEYGYSIVMFPAEGAYNIPQVAKWIADGDLVDAIETYHNVHKSIHGFRPSMSNTDQWADIAWVKAQTQACVAANEQEHMND